MHHNISGIREAYPDKAVGVIKMVGIKVVAIMVAFRRNGMQLQILGLPTTTFIFWDSPPRPFIIYKKDWELECAYR
jgi:hypothetical protein